MTHVPSIPHQITEAVRQRPARTWDGMLEGAFSRMFRGLVYPQIWEDPVADMAALALGPEDHLVTIASGGCNTLSYLTAGPAAITAVDLSPAHVALTRLKLVAARQLADYGQYRDFFACADRPGNPALYDARIAPALDADSRAWWEAPMGFRGRRIDMFARGFYRYGALGRFLGAVHLVARLGRVDFAAFLAAPDLAAQRRFFEERVDPLIRSRAVRFLASHRASLFGLGIPPAQYDKLAADGGGDILPVLRERVRKLMCDFPVAENYFAWQAFARRYAPGNDAALPPYLQERHFDSVRARAGRVRVLNRALTAVLAEAPAASCHAYVLLDAQDWMSDAQLAALWQEITRTAAPGARVIFRTGGRTDILPGRVPQDLLAHWRYDARASAAGLAADRSAIYGGFHLYRLAP